MAAIAIYMKTESGDSYLYCFPDQSIEMNLGKVKSSMDTELAYVNEFIVSGTEGMESYCKEFKKQLMRASQDMLGEEDEE